MEGRVGGRNRVRFKGFKDFNIGQLKWLGKSFNWCGCIHCQRATLVALVNVLIQHIFRNQFHMALLNGAVSQLLAELPRTLKGQNWVELNFQSI